MRVDDNQELSRYIHRRISGDLESEGGINILMTGFGPFRDHVVNASWEAVRLIPDKGIVLPPNISSVTPLNINAYEIPVVYNIVSDTVPKLWEKHQPDLVIHVGVSGIAKAITVEQYAHNCGYCSPDITDCIPTGNVCVGDGCDMLESGFDMSSVATTVNSTESGVHAEVSFDPGRYLCDFTYYTSLSINKDKTAFIHVPPLGKPWSADDMADAISLCITELLRQLEDRKSLQQFQVRERNQL